MTPKELVDGITHLASLPEVCIKINQMVDDPHYSAADIGKVVAHDTDLSARLLRTVNSAFYGLPAPIDTISRAITVIGTRDLRDLAVMTAARQLFKGIPADMMNMAEFWHYSVSTGVVSKVLAQKCNVLHSERLFVLGVLHDIGRLVIFQYLPERARDILLVTGGDTDVLMTAEQDILGFTHAEVGYELLKLWNLPDSLLTGVRFHHEPHMAEEYRLETALTHIGCMVATGLAWGEELDATLNRIDHAAWRLTGLTEETMEACVEEIEEQIAEMFSLVITPDSRRRRPSNR